MRGKKSLGNVPGPTRRLILSALMQRHQTHQISSRIQHKQKKSSNSTQHMHRSHIRKSGRGVTYFKRSNFEEMP